MENLNQLLMEAKEKLREYKKTQERFRETETKLRQEKTRLNNLKTKLDEEELDAKKLESFSITGLFYTILGSKESQFDKEKQEALAAKLKYDEALNSVKLLEKDLAVLRDYLEKHKDTEKEYENLLERKRVMILDSNDNDKAKLIELYERKGDLKADIKELTEAYIAGEKANTSLRLAAEKLQSASNWGTWDMLGGGTISTWVKHSKIDDADGYAKDAQHLLRTFEMELKDVNASTNLEINIGSFATFADYFFDGLIADWIVQSKIRDSLNNVDNVYRQVSKILTQLEKEKNRLEVVLQSVEEEIKSLIEQA